MIPAFWLKQWVDDGDVYKAGEDGNYLGGDRNHILDLSSLR